VSYLIDTNVLSELARPQPEPRVVDFMLSIDKAFLSTITLHELAYGLALKPDGQKRTRLTTTIRQLVDGFEHRILPVGQREATAAGELRAEAGLAGKTLHLADVLIAATAQCNRLTLATRNVRDFPHEGLEIINPWEA
jgi:predicted nucleic acid-binding protein